jgi:hypothetical protein
VAEANRKNTPPVTSGNLSSSEGSDVASISGTVAYYADESIKEAFKQEWLRASRRKHVQEPDWQAAVEALELAARVYEETTGLPESPTPSDVRAAQFDALAYLDLLRRQLQNPKLFGYSLRAKGAAAISGGVPEWLRPALAQLAALRDNMQTEIRELQELTAARQIQATRREDYRRDFLEAVFCVAEKLFDQRTGSADGPFIEFISLAAGRVLGDSVPAHDAIREMLRRRLKG